MKRALPSLVVARIEDFESGQHASFSKTFTDEDVRRFIEITRDSNPLHVDDEFAASVNMLFSIPTKSGSRNQPTNCCVTSL